MYEHDDRIQIKNAKRKLIIAICILIIVFVGLDYELFASLGIFNLHNIPNIEEVSKELDIDINKINQKLATTQEGVHFLESVVISVVFGNPWTGILIGFLKESFDIGRHVQSGTLNNTAIADGFLDFLFWFLGSLAGFYGVIPIHALFIKHNIRGFRDFFRFLRRKDSGEEQT